MNTTKRMLVRHVRESNAIEGIYDISGPLFVRHMQAARLVERNGRQGLLTHPLEIHRIMLPELGGFRKCAVDVVTEVDGVEVEAKPMPSHLRVPALMSDWDRAVMRWYDYVGTNPGPEWEPWISLTADKLMNWFFCIHPFVDGNGRTGRLVMNSFRRAKGLPWKIVAFSERQEHYAAIRDFEERTFRGWHPPEQPAP